MEQAMPVRLWRNVRLATLAEPIFEALSEGTITLDVAKAYASTENQEKQLLVWNSYGTSYANADTIRRVIANETMKSTDPVAILVGEGKDAAGYSAKDAMRMGIPLTAVVFVVLLVEAAWFHLFGLM